MEYSGWQKPRDILTAIEDFYTHLLAHHDVIRIDKVDAGDLKQSFTGNWSVIGNNIHDGVRRVDNRTHIEGEAIAKPPVRPTTVQQELASLLFPR